jgi:hypothetical protein
LGRNFYVRDIKTKDSWLQKTEWDGAQGLWFFIKVAKLSLSVQNNACFSVGLQAKTDPAFNS